MVDKKVTSFRIERHHSHSWSYEYTIDGKHRDIIASSKDELRQKVLEKGFPWDDGRDEEDEKRANNRVINISGGTISKSEDELKRELERKSILNEKIVPKQGRGTCPYCGEKVSDKDYRCPHCMAKLRSEKNYYDNYDDVDIWEALGENNLDDRGWH